jgi:intracellular sulfur oxidation DsrE/DsrF family protein
MRIDKKMKRILILLMVAVPLLAVLYLSQPGPQPVTDVAESGSVPSEDVLPQEDLPKKAVLDITVHTIDELKLLFDRAEELALAPQPPGSEASVVLVLHGPEVEFFATSNYDKYKDIVDQAARLDAFDVVDVKICQTMMEISGIPRDDIPAFIEQVPQGPAEVERLVREGYVYF